MVSEHASGTYVASYTVNGNEGAVLQAQDSANTEVNTDISLNTAEIVDTNDKDIEFIFTNKYEFQPYELPEAGIPDERSMTFMLFAGFIAFAYIYMTANKKKWMKKR